MPRYPDIEPYESGLLDTGDGNLVYWESCGNPGGVPALIVHGGPGSGCTAGNRRSFGAGSTTMTDQMHAAADRLYQQITNPPSREAIRFGCGSS